MGQGLPLRQLFGTPFERYWRNGWGQTSFVAILPPVDELVEGECGEPLCSCEVTFAVAGLPRLSSLAMHLPFFSIMFLGHRQTCP